MGMKFPHNCLLIRLSSFCGLGTFVENYSVVHIMIVIIMILISIHRSLCPATYLDYFWFIVCFEMKKYGVINLFFFLITWGLLKFKKIRMLSPFMHSIPQEYK